MNTNDTNEVADTPTTTPPSTPKAKAEKKAKSAKKPAAKKAAKKKAAPRKSAGKSIAKGAGPAEVLRAHAEGYVKDTEHKTASGNPSVHCNDTVAKKLLGKDLDEVYSITSKAIEVPMAELKRKYGHLNPGMQRMNLGNRLRGVLNAK